MGTLLPLLIYQRASISISFLLTGSGCTMQKRYVITRRGVLCSLECNGDKGSSQFNPLTSPPHREDGALVSTSQTRLFVHWSCVMMRLSLNKCICDTNSQTQTNKHPLPLQKKRRRFKPNYFPMVQRADVKISNIHSSLAMQLSLQNNRNTELETLTNFLSSSNRFPCGP